jgi:hypothetical protein
MVILRGRCRGGFYVHPIIKVTIPFGDDVKVAPTNAKKGVDRHAIINM